MEEIVKEYGFESLEEFHHMIANIDLTSPEKISAFKNWQGTDGTKTGLLKLQSV
jgi:AraC-like DNA-binding protein